MNKKAFTLIELLAVIIILAVILVIAVPIVNNIIKGRAKDAFFISAKSIVRNVENEHWRNPKFTKISLSNLQLTNISSSDYSLSDSYVYIENHVFKLNLVGEGKFEGLYACGITKNTKNVLVFNTPCPPIGSFICGDTLTDTRDGKVYSTVKIGDQCWMAEDLMYDCGSTTWDGNGCRLNGNAAGTIADASFPSMHYQWNAVMNGSTIEGSQGICPNGWHVPTDDEWKELEMHLGMTQSQANSNFYRGNNEGDKLKKLESNWCNNPEGCGESGFNALPSGSRNSSGTLASVGTFYILWSSSLFDDSVAWDRMIHRNNSQVSRWLSLMDHGLPVRCILE